MHSQPPEYIGASTYGIAIPGKMYQILEELSHMGKSRESHQTGKAAGREMAFCIHGCDGSIISSGSAAAFLLKRHESQLAMTVGSQSDFCERTILVRSAVPVASCRYELKYSTDSGKYWQCSSVSIAAAGQCLFFNDIRYWLHAEKVLRNCSFPAFEKMSESRLQRLCPPDEDQILLLPVHTGTCSLFFCLQFPWFLLV